MRQLSLVLITGLAVTLLACSSITVQSDYDPEVDFSKYGSYAWIPEPERENKDSITVTDDLLRQRIERAADAALSAKGMRRVPQQDASLLVTEHVSVKQKLRVNTTNYGYGYGRWGYYGGGYTDTQVDQYEQGTLVIDFIDANSKLLVWRGIAQKRLSKSTTPEENEKRVKQVVDAILAKYPPAKKK